MKKQVKREKKSKVARFSQTPAYKSFLQPFFLRYENSLLQSGVGDLIILASGIDASCEV